MRTTARTLAALTCSLLVGAAVPAMQAEASTPAPWGPDVSGWQHSNGAPIDWARVKAAGSSFAIVKATDGSSYVNPWFTRDRAAATANHVAVGAYAYVHPALPISTATTQAQHFAAAIGNQRVAGTLPPVMDLELSNGLSSGDLITWSQQFLETVRALTGRTPAVYTYPYFWSTAMANTSALRRYPLWLARYSSTAPAPLPGWPSWTMWQYSSTSQVSGIAGAVDLSRFAGTAAQLATYANGSVATAWPVTAPSAPGGVSARPGIRSASVSWRPSDDGGRLPTSYTVTASPGGAHTTVSGTTTRAAVAGLTAGTAYSFTVRAAGSAGSSGSSSPSAAVVAGQLPTVPGTPVAHRSAGAVSLSWAAAGGRPTSYLVHRCSPGPCTPSSSAVAVVTGTSWVNSGLTNGTPYTFSVSAHNAFGTSASSRPASATPLAAPSAPTQLATRSSASSITLTWAGPMSTGGTPITRYLVSVDGAAPRTLPATARSFVATGLRTGSWHRLTVSAGNLVGNGPAPAVTALATAVVPVTVSVTLPIALSTSGQPLSVAVRTMRADNGAVLPARPVTVSFRPAAGASPVAIHVVTDATGRATAVLHPLVSGTITAGVPATTTSSAAVRSVVRQVRTALTAALSVPSVRAGRTVTLTGLTSPLLAGERVYRQGYYTGAWHTWASALVDPTGHYRFTITPTVETVNHYRLWIAASLRHVAGASRTVDLTVM